jgi:hypothetical protein
MRRTLALVFAVAAVLTLAMLAGTASAGTQDFVLVNQTGSKINNLYISETKKDDWEEDVLGEDVLENGDSVTITFSGHKACTWDLMVKDEDGNGVYWREVDLCKVSTVTLHCNLKECWATYE